ncbi:MAG: carbohydrate-binding domain-containing protein, partial [Clostridia bacterium]|nr:carbohydrate-binding domain-containing protein [Clostridia bacterium]
DVIIHDGTFTISTLDDGIASDNVTKINGGKVTVLTSYEGIEGAYVEIGGGEIDVYATDDGINAASDDVTDEYIIISGGTTIVNAGGDGLDSNGSVLISGGTVFVHGPTNGGNASLDSESGIVVNGGYLIAVGSSGMVETPAQNSSQNVVSYTASSTIAAGSTISLRDSSGNVITSITTKKVCQSVIISCPELTKGSSYSIYVGDTQAYTFTVSSTITGGNGQGGFGPGGNMGPGGGFGPRG